MSVGLWSKSSFWVLCSGRVLYKYVYCLPLLYYITSMYALLLWVWAVWHKYKILYNRVKSPALFKNIFKFCTFLPKFSNLLPFFWKNPHMSTLQNRPWICKLTVKKRCFRKKKVLHYNCANTNSNKPGVYSNHLRTSSKTIWILLFLVILGSSSFLYHKMFKFGRLSAFIYQWLLSIIRTCIICIIIFMIWLPQ